MRILFVNPPSVVYDKTLHYYQATFSATASYLRSRFPSAELNVEAAGLTGATARTIVRHLVSGDAVDFLLLWTRVWEAPATLALARLARELSPSTRILVWGEATVYLPQYFERAPFDGICVSGDPELVLADALEGWGKTSLPGVTLAANGWAEAPTGPQLAPEDWPYPAPDVIDPQGYRIARENRGKPTDDLSFTISRGCPINCAAWCPTPRKEGLVDRRRPALATVEYMTRGPAPYQLFQLHSPLFVQNREWLREFIELKRQLAPAMPFKSVDLVNPYADERLVASLAEVGLKGIGFGIETLSADRKLTPKVDEQLLEQVARNFARYGVEGKAYTQLGLPGQKREDVLHTHQRMLDLGFTPRPTGATPFGRLRRMSLEELEGLDLTRWDRKSFYDPRCGLTLREFYELISCKPKKNVVVLPWAA